MPGPIKAHKTRFSVIVPRSLVARLFADARRIGAGVRASDVARGAFALYFAQSESVRAAAVREEMAHGDEEARRDD